MGAEDSSDPNLNTPLVGEVELGGPVWDSAVSAKSKGSPVEGDSGEIHRDQGKPREVYGGIHHDQGGPKGQNSAITKGVLEAMFQWIPLGQKGGPRMGILSYGAV